MRTEANTVAPALGRRKSFTAWPTSSSNLSPGAEVGAVMQTLVWENLIGWWESKDLVSRLCYRSGAPRFSLGSPGCLLITLSSPVGELLVPSCLEAV